MRWWTRAEDTLLRDLAARGATLDEAAAVLQPFGRVRAAIRQRALRTGLRLARKPTRVHVREGKIAGWTKEQDDLLRSMAPTREAQEIARAVGKRVYSVHLRAARLHVTIVNKRVGRSKPWSAKEIAALRWHVEGAGRGSLATRRAYVARKLGRTPSAVQTQAARIGLDWIQGTISTVEAARELRVTRHTVLRHRRDLGLGSLTLEDLPLLARSILAKNYDKNRPQTIAALRERASEYRAEE